MRGRQLRGPQTPALRTPALALRAPAPPLRAPAPSLRAPALARSARALALSASCLALAACGLAIQSADLFLLTRTGQGQKLTLLVSDGGTVRCNGAAPRHLPDRLLLRARDLAGSLDADARRHLRIPASPNSAFRYRVELQNGAVSFPDTAGARHRLLARVELFAVQAARQACGISA